MIAGDHDDADARLVAALDRIGDLRPRRIEHGHEAEQHEVPLGVLAAAGEVAVGLALGHGENPQAVVGVCIDQPLESTPLGRVQRFRPAVSVDGSVATRQDRFRRALGVDPSSVVRCVDRRHELERGIEVELGPPPSLAGVVVDVGTQAPGGGEQRKLRGIAARVPVAPETRVVARGDRDRKRPKRRRPLAGCLVDRPLEVELARRRPDPSHPHPVLGQSARLVGAHDVGRAERLDRAEPLDDRALANEPAHPHGQS